MRPLIALVLLTLVLLASCGSDLPRWRYGLGPYSQEDQEAATAAAMDVYRDVLGDDPIDTALDRHVRVSWRLMPFACGRVPRAAGCFDPYGAIITLVERDQALPDTAYAHELLHAALFAARRRGAYSYTAPDERAYATTWALVVADAQSAMRAVLP